MAPGTDRIAYIDALRGLAITGVILTHVASAIALEGPLRMLAGYGGYGVQLFFIVSAFTIFMTYDHARERESAPLRNFFIRRLLRIVPVYWAGIVLYTLVYGNASRGWLPGPEVWHYPFHLTLTNIFLPDGTSSVVPGGWSISVEVLFYLTAPLWFVLVTSLRRAVAFTLIWIVLGTLFIEIGTRSVDLSWVSEENRGLFWFRQVPSQLACFGFGMILYYGTLDARFMAWLRRPQAQAILLPLAAVAIVLSVRGERLVPNHYLVCALFLYVAFILSQYPVAPLVNSFTRMVGRISYSAYLLHFIVIQALLAWLPWPEAPAWRFLSLTMASFAVTVAVSWLSWRYYEMLWTRLARTLIGRLEARHPRAPAGALAPAVARSRPAE